MAVVEGSGEGGGGAWPLTRRWGAALPTRLPCLPTHPPPPGWLFPHHHKFSSTFHPHPRTPVWDDDSDKLLLVWVKASPAENSPAVAERVPGARHHLSCYLP